MSIQAYIGLLFLIVVTCITAVFLLFWRISKRNVDPDSCMPRFSRIQTVWIFTIIVISAVLTLATLPLIHYPGVAGPVPEPRQVMTVEGRQFGWEFEPKQVTVGVPVEFRATSRDVNHGFGVFDSNGVLLFQVQAMPKYVNRAIYTFEKPGTYRIGCMEYCGMAHHIMSVTFEVVP